jgi:hypothetical protein
MHDGTFQDVALKAGVAFSEDGKARAGMGVDVADYDNSGIPGLVVTNFDNEMLGFYRGTKGGIYIDQAPRSNIGRLSQRSLGFGCFFFDADLDGLRDRWALLTSATFRLRVCKPYCALRAPVPTASSAPRTTSPPGKSQVRIFPIATSACAS